MGTDKKIIRRRKPTQERSCEMVEWILEAAMRLFSEKGYKATTTNKIAELAGISIGSFYRYFPNKESLLLELGLRHRKKLYHEILYLMNNDPGDNLEEILKKIIVMVIKIHRETPLFIKAYTVDTNVVRHLESMDIENNQKFWGIVVRIINRKYRSSRPFLKTENLHNAWNVVGKSVKAIIHNIAAENLSVSDEEITDTLVQVILSYLDK